MPTLTLEDPVPRHTPLLPLRGRTLGLAALALTLPVLPALVGAADAAPPSAAAAAHRAAPGPLRLYAPQRLEAMSYGGRTYTDLGLRLVAGDEPFELWSHRTGYDQKIQTVWRSRAGDVALPAGSMSTFGTLRHFLKVSIKPLKGDGAATTMVQGACLAGYSERVTPDAPAVSDYPRSCYYNPYALGAVQGIQAGWATPVLNGYKPLRLAPGRYQVTSTIASTYAARLGLSASESRAVTTLVVRREDAGSGNGPSRNFP